ncbi:hypothetical protein GWI33_017258 [Rhynchophorus ferrugineus]|uniref:Uncharacterized protein n=1 Tax=Rhynchophorus ferrugineus TaxID=354439 RepID=A0A834I2E6_RHYFE|nr:hypothetical protein GWI33_017258 [Rhynchophorus ferrugineus]
MDPSRPLDERPADDILCKKPNGVHDEKRHGQRSCELYGGGTGRSGNSTTYYYDKTVALGAAFVQQILVRTNGDPEEKQYTL